MRFFYLIFLITSIAIGCRKSDLKPTTFLDYQVGKNVYTILQDSHSRDFIIHVPQIYDSLTPTPIVFMLHGTSGNGEKFYNISGWRQVADQEGFLSVFPSSGSYCILQNGKENQTTKWTVPNRDWTYCRGDVPHDDIAFISEILQLMANTFNVDQKRIYVAGFSNGGKMAAHIATTMSDQIAAVTQNSGSITPDTVFAIDRPMSTILQYGNYEDRFRILAQGQPYPLSQLGEAIVNYPPLKDIVTTHINTFELDSTFSISGDTNKIVTAYFHPRDPLATHEFQVKLINNMSHIYPNGNNHPYFAAQEQWNWFKQFKLE